MCLATPGLILQVIDDHPLRRTAVVSFGSVERRVNIALVPEAATGDVVLIHAGIAISVMAPEDLQELSALLKNRQATPPDPAHGESR